jgi:hypothetical protein
MRDQAAAAMEEALSWRGGVVIGVQEARLHGWASRTSSRFIALCRDFTSTGGRARTDTVLSHHRILSPARLPIPPLRRGEPRHYNNVQSSADCL